MGLSQVRSRVHAWPFVHDLGSRVMTYAHTCSRTGHTPQTASPAVLLCYLITAPLFRPSPSPRPPPLPFWPSCPPSAPLNHHSALCQTQQHSTHCHATGEPGFSIHDPGSANLSACLVPLRSSMDPFKSGLVSPRFSMVPHRSSMDPLKSGLVSHRSSMVPLRSSLVSPRSSLGPLRSYPVS